MLTIKNKSDLKNRTFKVLRENKGLSIEDIPGIKANILAQIKDIKGAVLTETETAFELNNGQFFLKPVRKRETTGFLKCGPTCASFNGERVDYKDMSVDSVFLIIETEQSKFSIHSEV